MKSFLCTRFNSIPFWVSSFALGIFIGWTTYALNSRLLSNSESQPIVTPRTNWREPAAGNDDHLSREHFHRLLPKYQATSKFDLQSWIYFDSAAMYNDDSINMVHWRRGTPNDDVEIKTALELATVLVGKQRGRNVHMKSLTSGYLRHNPTRGYEYIIDAQYVDSCRSCVAKPFSRRISFVRPPSEPIVIPDVPTSNTIVNIVVPISNVNSRFSEFMENYEQAFLKHKDAVHLLVVVYQEDISALDELLNRYRSKYKSAQITLLHAEGAFSRGRALHNGISYLDKNDLVFICDVDISIERSFLDRCRRNTIQGERVFYPVVFKQYNPKYTNITHGKTFKNGRVQINRKTGHWFYYSYGMLCVYKSDYIAVGGLDIQIEGWGLEDVLLYLAILKAKIEVLKVPDPALQHRWHESRCPSTLPNKQLSDCLGSLYDGVADKMDLAKYIYKNGYQL